MNQAPKPILPGDVFSLNGGGSCTVTQYFSWDRILVRHNDCHAHEMIVQASHLRRGGVKNPYHPSVYGVGFLGVGPHSASSGRTQPQEYKIWLAMLQRAYDPEKQRKCPTYVGVTVCDEWLNFQNFADWFKAQPNSDSPGFQLDKDLSIPGSRVYSPDTCSFVPALINSITTDCASARGSLPVGVTFRARDNKFYAQMNIDGVMRHIGLYETQEEAFSAYKAKRESRIRLMAERYRHCISDAVYQRLSTWSVSPF